MESSLLSHEDIVLLLIKKATEYQGTETKGVLGKKALQKTLYFFNQEKEIFSFKWGDFGPISEEVQQIVLDLIENKNVKVTMLPTKKPGIFIQKLKFSEENNSDFLKQKGPSKVDDNLDNIIKFAATKSPRELELLASVHYWAVRQKSMQDEYTIDYIFEKLTDLKPDAGFTTKDVENAIQSLEDSNYLSKD